MATETISATAEHLPSEAREAGGHSNFLRLFAILLLTSAAVIGVVGFIFDHQVRGEWESALRAELTRSLTHQAKLFAARVDSDRSHSLEVIASQEGQAAEARATIVDSAGKIVADSEIPLAALEKEGKQPEFVTALRGSVGMETRSRNGIPSLYVAVPMAGGAVRLATPLSDLEAASTRSRHQLWIACLLSLIPACLISGLGAILCSRR